MAVNIEMREKDRLKDISSYIETLWDSLVVDERSKHRPPFLHPARLLFSSTTDDKNASLTFGVMSSYFQSTDIAFDLFIF